MIKEKFKYRMNNIFIEDEQKNKIYKIFPWSKGVIVNDVEIQEALLSIEGYKPFIISYKPPIIIPIIIFSFLISVFLSFTKIVDIDMDYLVFYISISFYILSCCLFFMRIYFIIKKCKNNS